ncbi:MAG: hypothetical protein WC450_05015 [Candidatus Omnitrophota bacterium]|jgi:hypothetical protein
MELIISFFKLIINFINSHFEHILLILILYVSGLGSIVLTLFLRRIRRKVVAKAVNHVLHGCLLAGFAMLIALTLYSYMINLVEKASLDFSYQVTPTTVWVEEDLKIYFIHENQLVRINADGTQREVVFESADAVRTYHFSPDGRYLLIATESGLWILNRTDQTSREVEILARDDEAPGDIKGVVDGIAWAPDSLRFCYHIARWTGFSSIDHWIIYNLTDQSKQMLRSPSLKINALLWDTKGENLYDLWFNALDTTVYANPYEVKVYQIPLTTLKPDLIVMFPFDEPKLPEEHLALRGIDVFTRGQDLSFGQEGKKHFSMISSQGSRLGVDDFDYLYYIHNRWWRRKLFRVPRVPRRSDIPRYQYSGGELAIKYMRWTPSGRYVVMEHYFLGLLILEPQTGKIGLLANEKEGYTFGWYTPPDF